jgi:hypothetical protein
MNYFSRVPPVYQSYPMPVVAPYLPIQNQLNLPTGKLNLPPGVNAKINFYDPLTGRIEHSMSTLPKVDNVYSYRSGDVRVDVTGNRQNVSEIRDLLKNRGQPRQPQLQQQLENLMQQQQQIQQQIEDQPKQRIELEKQMQQLREKSQNMEKQVALLPPSAKAPEKKSKYVSIDEPTVYDNNNEDDKCCDRGYEYNTMVASVGGIPIATTGPWSFNNNILLNSGSNVSYTGSGVTLFETYRGRPTVILTRNINGGCYEDMGGHIESSQFPAGCSTLALNAKKELFEESCKLFQINGCDLDLPINGFNHYIDAMYDGSAYRSYLVGLTGLNYYDELPILFGQNRHVISRSGLSSEYNETDHICRFGLTEVLKAAESTPTGRIRVQNLNGSICNLSERSSDIFRKLRNNEPLLRSIYNKPYSVNYSVQRPVPQHLSPYQLTTFTW